MKRCLLVLLLASAASGQQVQTKLEGKWEFVAMGENGSAFYVDSSKVGDVEGKPASKQFWVLVDKETKQIRTEMVVDCAASTFLTGPEYQYKKSGSLLAKIEEWDTEPRGIEEGTVFDTIKNYVCNP